jgi:LPS export ABC transporter protein LptC
MSWHRPARIAVGLLACASAVWAYLAVGRRPVATPPPRVQRVDARATIEATGAVLQREQGGEEQFEVQADRTLNYADGSKRQFGVRVSVRNRSGKDFTVTADEARTGAGDADIRLAGRVALSASDGFELRASEATYDQERGVVEAPGSVSFARGRLSGTATGMLYDVNAEILTLVAMPDVQLAPAERAETAREGMRFQSGTATLDRVQHVLSLADDASVARGRETLRADDIVARLAEDEQGVDVVELHGRARASGTGSALEAMTARDITLDYAADGSTLERALLLGDANVSAAGQKGGEPKRFSGSVLDLGLDPDGNVSSATGREGVRVELPGASTGRGQSISGREFEAAYGPGGALTDLRVAENVEYLDRAGSAARAVRARALRLRLSSDAIASAAFSGGAVFEEGALVAKAQELQFDPRAERLVLVGDPASPESTIADEWLSLAARGRIEVTLATRDLSATGGVKTVLSPSNARGGRGGRLPNLLAADQSVQVHADSLVSTRDGDRLGYRGTAALWQGDTAVRADELSIDRGAGLVARGSARLSLPLQDGLATGRATAITFAEPTRELVFDTPPAGRGGGAPPSPQSYLSATPGDIRADRISLRLASRTSAIDRLEAVGRVALKRGARTASGQSLTYQSAEERYELRGSAADPVSVVESCRATTGRRLIFYGSTDRILVDGDNETRTQSKGVASCVPTTR